MKAGISGSAAGGWMVDGSWLMVDRFHTPLTINQYFRL